MKANAKAQHELDRAEFRAVRAESKACFEENRGRNSLRRARAERANAENDARLRRLAEAERRTAAAEARYNAARK